MKSKPRGSNSFVSPGAMFELELIIVTRFEKREAGKDRLLYQVGEEYNTPAMCALAPYMSSWMRHPLAAVGYKGTAELRDMFRRLAAFRMYPSNACADHKGYNEKHTMTSNVTFWATLSVVDKKYFGHVADADVRSAIFDELAERVQCKVLLIARSDGGAELWEALERLRAAGGPPASAEYRWIQVEHMGERLAIIWRQSLMSAKIDTMLRNTGLGIPYLEAQLSVVRTVISEEAMFAWCKGDDSACHFRRRWAAQLALISGSSVRHVLSNGHGIERFYF